MFSHKAFLKLGSVSAQGGFQIVFAKLKSKIEDETIKREDLYMNILSLILEKR